MPKKRLDIAQASHAIQTGVKFDLETGSESASPKHLRTGLNIAMVTDAAVVRLLIQKGIFTEQEYQESLTDELNKEVDRYQEALSKKMGGADITLL